MTPAPTPTTAGTATTEPVPPPVAKTGAGGLGFVIVLVLIFAAIGIFYAQRSSLRRLRERQADGTFAGERPRSTGSGDRGPTMDA